MLFKTYRRQYYLLLFTLFTQNKRLWDRDWVGTSHLGIEKDPNLTLFQPL